MHQILLVEDDRRIADGLSEFLSEEGFHVLAVRTQSGAERLLRERRFDLALVDISLAEGSGFGACTAAKEKGVPVIFLTASGDENSVVRGLEMGADDYVAKPFRPRELVSRIRTVLRRTGSQSVYRLGDITIDADKAAVHKNGAEIGLSALEYRILLLFAANRGRVLTRGRLLEEIWDIAGDFVNDNTLTVYIKRLRDKLEDDPQNPTLIKTVRGIGYRVGE